MIGLMVLLFFAIYLAITIWITRATANWAKRNNRSPWRWGGLAAFAMYNLVFWDFIPTLIAHKYYCATEAGFWVYKTPEQWMQENPGVAETLVATPSKSENLGNELTRYWVNQRLYFEVRRKRNFVHALWREDERLVDADTQQVLAKVVSFSRGVSGNVIVMGGTLDEFRQALVLGWGERNCMSDGMLLTDSFAMNIHNYYTVRGGK